jgi:hypothetical protein
LTGLEGPPLCGPGATEGKRKDHVREAFRRALA